MEDLGNERRGRAQKNGQELFTLALSCNLQRLIGVLLLEGREERAPARRSPPMKRSSNGDDSFLDEEHARRKSSCLERAISKYLDHRSMPMSILQNSFTPDLQTLTCSGALESLLTKAQELAAAPVDLDALRLTSDVTLPSKSSAKAASAKLESPTTAMALLPGLSRQQAFCPAVLTTAANEEHAAETVRCVGAIARLARRCGALENRSAAAGDASPP